MTNFERAIRRIMATVGIGQAEMLVLIPHRSDSLVMIDGPLNQTDLIHLRAAASSGSTFEDIAKMYHRPLNEVRSFIARTDQLPFEQFQDNAEKPGTVERLTEIKDYDATAG